LPWWFWLAVTVLPTLATAAVAPQPAARVRNALDGLVFLSATMLAVYFIVYLITDSGLAGELGVAVFYLYVVLISAAYAAFAAMRPELRGAYRSGSAVAGVAYGSLAFLAVMGIAAFSPASIAQFHVGGFFMAIDATPVLVFLSMLLVVAIPEELFFRLVFAGLGTAYYGMGLGLAYMYYTWAYLHYVSRAMVISDTALLMVVIGAITLAGTFTTIAYLRHGLLSSVVAHALYNTLIYTAAMGLDGAVAAVVFAAAVTALYVLRGGRL